MMNIRKTLENLHKKFPNLTLDDLFAIIDCYVEEGYSFGLTPNTSYLYKKEVDLTNSKNFIKAEDITSISSKLPKYIMKEDYSNNVTTTGDGKNQTIYGPDYYQLTAHH